MGITRGCSTEAARFCPTDPVTRAQMATFLVRAFQLEPEPSNKFADVEEGNTHTADINALAASGITAGCAIEPARYCPVRDTIRAQMATFLARALGIDAVPQPEETTPPPESGGFAAIVSGCRFGDHAGLFNRSGSFLSHRSGNPRADGPSWLGPSSWNRNRRTNSLMLKRATLIQPTSTPWPHRGSPRVAPSKLLPSSGHNPSADGHLPGPCSRDRRRPPT